MNHSTYSDNEKDIEDIAADNIAYGHGCAAIGGRDNADTELWHGCAEGYYGEAYDEL